MNTSPADTGGSATKTTDPRPPLQGLDAWLPGRLILVVLVLIAYTITGKSLPVFGAKGVSFFTERRWAPGNEVYGALSFIYGTAVTALIAVVISVPVSIGIALFTTQVAPAVAEEVAGLADRPRRRRARRSCSVCGASSSSPRSSSGSTRRSAAGSTAGRSSATSSARPVPAERS